MSAAAGGPLPDNVFADARPPATGERFETLVRHGRLEVERIVSSATPEAGTYVQAQDEWVLLVRGDADLTVGGMRVTLEAGDHLFLAAGVPHTVERTSEGALWVAVHLHPEAAAGETGEAPGPHPRVATLVRDLGLVPHPEGGHYREVFRSSRRVEPLDGRSPRPSLTSIHFLLAAGERSRWHRVASDEAWHLAEGGPLDLVWIDADGNLHVDRIASGDEGASPVAVVPAGCWQAARPVGAYALVGCTVGPGFDFADFTLLDPDGPDAAWVQRAAGPWYAVFA